MVCKVTAVRCAHLLLFAGIAEIEAMQTGHQNIQSQSGELLTARARTAVKILYNFFTLMPRGSPELDAPLSLGAGLTKRGFRDPTSDRQSIFEMSHIEMLVLQVCLLSFQK